MTAIMEIEGVAAAQASKLADAGIRTEEALLEAGASQSGRAGISAKTGISEKVLLEWVNRADLARIKGIGREYGDLLEASGVDSVPELAQRKAESLHMKMEEVNATRKLVRVIPGLSTIEKWIREAKTLPKVVTH